MTRCIVIPVVNNLALTRRCVESALAQDVQVHLMIIDNGSRDGVEHYLRSLPTDRVTLITFKPGRSLHYVWNLALSLVFDVAQEPTALVINNDVVLRHDTYRLLEEDGGGLVTGVAVDRVDTTAKSDLASTRSPHPAFSCFLIRRHVWQQVGRFDEQFYAWAGDGDYHLRADAAGIDAYAIALPFYHETSNTIRTAEPEEHLRLCALADDDRNKFARKWGCQMDSDMYYSKFRSSPKLASQGGSK